METVLALLAIGIGLIGLFGLGRLGLESSRETENDRRCAMLADAVFETLRAVNAIYIDEARTNMQMHGTLRWNVLWEGVDTLPQAPNHPLLDENGSIRFPPVAGMSAAELQYEPKHPRVDDFGFHAYDPNDISLADWNPRYHLIIENPPDSYSDITQSPNALQVILYIYPDGETGSSPPRIFTTLLHNSGGMP